MTPSQSFYVPYSCSNLFDVEKLLLRRLEILGDVPFEPQAISEAGDLDFLDRIENQHLADVIIGAERDIGWYR